MRFHDRHDAGRQLAELLQSRIRHPAIVYALPRGGVPVAVEVARAADLPLDLVIARKIGHPMQPEYAVCAVTEGGAPVCDPQERRHLDPVWLEAQIDRQRQEARRRREVYLEGRPRRPATGRCAIIVDDGMATGLSMEAAVREIRSDAPSRLIVAVPVAPGDQAARFAGLCDDFIAVLLPETYAGAVGNYYEQFGQLDDSEVVEELARVPRPRPGSMDDEC